MTVYESQDRLIDPVVNLTLEAGCLFLLRLCWEKRDDSCWQWHKLQRVFSLPRAKIAALTWKWMQRSMHRVPLEGRKRTQVWLQKAFLHKNFIYFLCRKKKRKNHPGTEVSVCADLASHHGRLQRVPAACTRFQHHPASHSLSHPGPV